MQARCKRLNLSSSEHQQSKGNWTYSKDDEAKRADSCNKCNLAVRPGTLQVPVRHLTQARRQARVAFPLPQKYDYTLVCRNRFQ